MNDPASNLISFYIGRQKELVGERDEAVAKTKEARTWARRYKKLYEYAEGYRHGWQVQSEIEEELRKQAEQDSDYACSAYRDMYEQWAKAEREKRELLWHLAEVEAQRDNLQQQRDELQEQNTELVAALKDLVSACQSCGGTGIYYNSRDCRYCRVGRFALAKLE